MQLAPLPGKNPAGPDDWRRIRSFPVALHQQHGDFRREAVLIKPAPFYDAFNCYPVCLSRASNELGGESSLRSFVASSRMALAELTAMSAIGFLRDGSLGQELST